MRLTVVLLGIGALAAADPAPPAASADPSQAIVAEAGFVYRQRDLDALLLVAMRHARAKEFAPGGAAPLLTASDEEAVRQALIRGLTAREALIAALAGLPERIPAAARDAIALDLLAYRAEPSASQAKPGTAPTTPSGPVIVRLPPLTITKAVEGHGRRQLTIGLALAFADAGLAKTLEAQAPVVQDAVLGALRGLPPTAYLDPDHAALKSLLNDAIRTKVPAMPADALLIAQLDSGPADAPAER